MSKGRSRIATIRAAFSLVGAILQGGKGETHESDAVRSTRQEPIAEGFGETDVYRPVDTPPSRTAVLMMHGLTKDGIDDRRIPTFASMVARGGMPVVVPDFPRMRKRLMSVEDTDDVFRAARAVPAAIDADKVVLLAFSYAAGPTFLAGARLDDELAGIVTVGAYYDVDHLVEFTATGGVQSYGTRQPTAHDPSKQLEGRWVFLSSAARWLADPSDREQVAAGTTAWKEGNPPRWADVRETLSPEGQALLDHITSADAAAHSDAAGRLPEAIKAAFDKLTLRGRLDALDAPVVLIHGRHDVRIPFRESLLLRDDLAQRIGVKLAILNAFVHAERAFGWSKFWRVAGDGAKLGRCGFEILRWAV